MRIDPLLANEKRLTHERDALAAKRRRMPWLAVEKQYEFDGPKGNENCLSGRVNWGFHCGVS